MLDLSSSLIPTPEKSKNLYHIPVYSWIFWTMISAFCQHFSPILLFMLFEEAYKCHHLLHYPNYSVSLDESNKVICHFSFDSGVLQYLFPLFNDIFCVHLRIHISKMSNFHWPVHYKIAQWNTQTISIQQLISVSGAIFVL